MMLLEKTKRGKGEVCMKRVEITTIGEGQKKKKEARGKKRGL